MGQRGRVSNGPILKEFLIGCFLKSWCVFLKLALPILFYFLAIEAFPWANAEGRATGQF